MGTISLSDGEVFPASEREGPAADIIISFIKTQDEGGRGAGGAPFSSEPVKAAASQRETVQV